MIALNISAQARWLKTIKFLNEQGEAQQLKRFASEVELPPDDPQVARLLLNKVRLERTHKFEKFCTAVPECDARHLRLETNERRAGSSQIGARGQGSGFQTS